MNTLQMLNIADNDLQGDTLSDILMECNGLKSLTTIDMTRNNFKHVDYHKIEKYLNSESCFLKKFILVECQMNMLSLAEILGAAANNSRIRELNVSSNNFEITRFT